MGSLTVYKASAGSGKTFSLACRFISLLVRNPLSFREILAVTFTTKATEEMKTRILGELYGLAFSLPSSDVYLKEIMSSLPVGEALIRERARRSLQLILHDYGRFNVETIDAFFQRILRGIARELELNANMRVELGQEEVEEAAVDRLISGLTAGDRALGWIMKYIRQNIQEDKSWNVIGKIKDFGKKIYARQYRENSSAIDRIAGNDALFDSFASRLRGITAAAEKRMKDSGNGFFALLASHGYAPEDLAYGSSGVAGYFLKLQNGCFEKDKDVLTLRVISALESADKWVSKSKANSPLRVFAERELLPYLQKTEKLRKELQPNYLSAKAILEHINEVRLLRKIECGVEEINKETNSIMLSDTQSLLHSLMEGGDAPFIYEKTGGRIRHIMIDEMQDTSVIQWENFKKLLLECLSHGNSESLIVGDVKQSIYRWRNSDWHILNSIAGDKDFKNADLLIQTLDTNWRSDVNVIRFNNEFFRLAALAERDVLASGKNENAETIRQIYPDEETGQKYPGGRDVAGRVEIRLLGKENFDERCINMIAEHIDKLKKSGVKEEDIAVITRTNGSLVKIGKEMEGLLPGCRFVSDEAFKLKSSAALDIIINAMRVVAGRQTEYYGALLAWKYCVHILERDPSEFRFHTMEEIFRCLPNGFSASIERLKALPLQSMAQEISGIFNVEKLKDETAYVNMFFDCLNAFARTFSPDVNTFTEYWDSTLSEKTVKSGDVPGIKMMTIHKSKGLEFGYVIVPYCDWKTDKSDTLWCSSDKEPFSGMPIVPVEASALENTVWQKEYREEVFNNAVDNLNLLYVAFTRAKSGLLVIGKRGLNKDGVNFKVRSGLLEAVLPQMEKTLKGCSLSYDGDEKKGDLNFSFGTLTIRKSEEKVSQNIFAPLKKKEMVEMKAPAGRIEFRQSNRSRAFVNGEDDEAEDRKYIKRGTILHDLLSKIRDSSCAERVLREFVREGVVSESGGTTDRETLARLIRKRIMENGNSLVNGWFAPGVKVLNECTILSLDPATGQVRQSRPDRVVVQGNAVTVIDFKFAAPKEAHKVQVRGYMRLLREMKRREVSGYLWYVYNNKVEKIEEI